MKARLWLILAGAGLMATGGSAQSVLFDFNNLTATTTFPLNVMVGGITAYFSGTGSSYSIQPANTMGFTPTNFSGNCIFPNGGSTGDLLVSFSQPLISFSIWYAPQELGCDSSAIMRVTTYLNGTYVGTATTNATATCPCNWPGQILQFDSAQRFNSVVVHYDKAPACADIGPIFMADNMNVTPAPPPLILTGPMRLPGGEFQFSFTYTPGGTNMVLATTNLAQVLSNWNVLGAAVEILPGQFQFTDPQATNGGHRFYRVLSQ